MRWPVNHACADGAFMGKTASRCPMVFSWAQKQQIKPLQLEIFEIFVERDDAQAALDGEGRQISIHPDFGRGSVDGGKRSPFFKDAGRLSLPADLGQGLQSFECLPYGAVGLPYRIVCALDRRRGRQAHEALLGGAAPHGGLRRGALQQSLLGQRVKNMLWKCGGKPDIGVKQKSRHVACPHCKAHLVRVVAIDLRSCVVQVRYRHHGKLESRFH